MIAMKLNELLTNVYIQSIIVLRIGDKIITVAGNDSGLSLFDINRLQTYLQHEILSMIRGVFDLTSFVGYGYEDALMITLKE